MLGAVADAVNEHSKSIGWRLAKGVNNTVIASPDPAKSPLPSTYAMSFRARSWGRPFPGATGEAWMRERTGRRGCASARRN